MFTLRLLGSLDLRDEDGTELRRVLRQPKRMAVLAFLAGSEPGIFHRRDRLLALFWPESTTKSARHGLRQVLYELRKDLGDDAILQRGAEEIALNHEVIACDLTRLESAIAEDHLEEAIELYGGPFLDGFFVSSASGFMDWLDRRRAEVLRRAVDAAWRLVELRRAEEDHAGAWDAARRAVQWAPTDEAGVRRLISLLHERGHSWEAIRVYERLVKKLATEFEGVPSAETTELIARVRDDVKRSESGEVDGSASRGPPQKELTEDRAHAAASEAGAEAVAEGDPQVVAQVVSVDEPALRRSRWGRGAGVVGLLGAVTVAFVGLRALGTGIAVDPPAEGPFDPLGKIVVAEFENRTTDQTLAMTLTELLRIDLSQSRAMRLMDSGALTATLERIRVPPNSTLDQTLAMEVARREGLGAVLVGDVAPLGTGFALSARLISVSDGASLAAERATAEDETQLIAAVDSLSARLRLSVGESLADVGASPPLERVTTHSLEALRKYSTAMGPAGLEDGQMAGVRLLDEAVALDSTFAMAYRRLAVVLGQAGYPERSRTSLRRAFELLDHLPAVEQQLVRALYHTDMDYDAKQIEDAYRAALELEPDNVIALVNLASHQSRLRNWAAREAFAQASLTARRSFVGTLNLLSAQLLQGKFRDATATVERMELAGGSPPVNRLFDLQAAQRQYNDAEAELLGNPEAADPLRMGNILRLRGRIAEAEETFRLHGRAFPLATLHADYGSPEEVSESLTAFDTGDLAWSERRLPEQAELLARAGETVRARALVTEFESHLDPELTIPPSVRGALARASGEIAISEGRFADAATAFRDVNELSGTCTTCGLARLGYALDQLGQHDSARTAYERVLTTHVDGLNGDDARWLPWIYKRLGELYEDRGNNEAAVERYADFVEIWKDADAVLQPQVSDVRERIARLGGES